MNTIFIGGSRHVSRLPAEVKKRLDNVIESGHEVIVGDANGADKAVQKHFYEHHYEKVTVFCSGDNPRNNLGEWRIHRVDSAKGAKGFQFYAAKDRAMAHSADFGLMIWDGNSPGTVLNVLRLVQAGKISVLFNVPTKSAINIKSTDHWNLFLTECTAELRLSLKERATPDEWEGVERALQPNLFPSDFIEASKALPTLVSRAELTSQSNDVVAKLNQAFADDDAKAIIDILGVIARSCGMSRVARDTGLARESLYRSLDIAGNPEFASILKVLSSVGLQLEVKTKNASEV